MRSRPLILLTLLLAQSLPAFAQQPSAAAAEADAPAPEAATAPGEADALPEAKPHAFSAAAAPDHVKLGEQFVLTVEVRDAKSEHYELPKDFSLGKDCDLVEVEVSREPQGDELLTRFRIRAALFALGEAKLPDLQLLSSGPAGQKRLTIPGPPLTGVGQLGEDEQAQPLDILPPVDVKVPDYRALWVLLGTLAVAALGLLLWRWLRRRPRRAPAVRAEPPLPAHLSALAALEALQREELPAQGRGREFHFRLSEILRTYFGERFGFAAIDMTTEELLGALARLRTPGLDYAGFEALCRESDLIKYAKAPAQIGDCKSALEAAFGFVQATAPQPKGEQRPSTTGAAA